MSRMDILADALSAIMNASVLGKSEVVVPRSKLVGAVLYEMQKAGYIGMFEIIDDGRGGKIKVQLLGRINKCGAIKPRFSFKKNELDKWVRHFLPARGMGIVIVSTSQGIMSHEEAMKRGLGGVLLAYVY
ncbi:MAG: 30S ribosomal protein S8 [Candidatus Odinarchaeota archaeon]|nr:30S ribosomal protein S8 [Candidatus Odinarchaeota archaeon]